MEIVLSIMQLQEEELMSSDTWLIREGMVILQKVTSSKYLSTLQLSMGS